MSSSPDHLVEPSETPSSSSSSSSGVRTPALAPNPHRASSSYLSNMWSGLIRRFSAEDSHFPSQADTAIGDDDKTNGHGHSHSHAKSPPKDGINGVFSPARRTASPFRPPPLDPLVLHGYRPSTPESAKLLTIAVAEEIRTMVPERLRIVEDWRLVYSLEQDGASLATLYQRCRQFEGRRAGFVLVVKDEEGGVSFSPMTTSCSY